MAAEFRATRPVVVERCPRSEKEQTRCNHLGLALNADRAW